MNVLLLLFAVVTQAPASEIELKAPETCVIGELVRLDASKSEAVIWEVVPPTPDFQAVGNIAFFSSRAGGDYLIVVASTNGGKPLLKTHKIHVEPAGTPASNLDFTIKELLKEVVTTNGREEAIKLAQSFRAIGGTALPSDQILDATAKANRAALGKSLDAWKPFLDGLATYLDENQVTNYPMTWNAIADSIERHVK